MKIIVYTTAFFIGIGQNLPWESMYIGGIGVGDIMLISTVFLQTLSTTSRDKFVKEAIKNKRLFSLILIFVLLTLLSMAKNAITRDLDPVDLIEAFRPLYYFVMTIFFIVNIKKYGVNVVVSFVNGVLFSVVISYIESENRNVLGTVMLWNPNVIGNMIAVSVLLISFTFFSGIRFVGLLYIPLFAAFSLMTYSKGTWIMMFLSLFLCMIAYQSLPAQHSRFLRFIRFAVPFGFVILFMENLEQFNELYEKIYELVSFKISTTQFGDSAQAGGTFAARLGFVRASLHLAITNPFFGVGISNFESSYESLSEMLGDDYWPSDNPHSAWLYLIACFGIPATIVFFIIFYNFILQLYKLVPLTGLSKWVYCVSFILVLLISGATQLQILTQHFFWFMIAVVYGLNFKSSVTSHIDIRRIV